MKWNILIKLLVMAPLAALSLWNCGGSGSNGSLSIDLTDAPTEEYEAVYVTVKTVEVQMLGDAEDSWETTQAQIRS